MLRCRANDGMALLCAQDFSQYDGISWMGLCSRRYVESWKCQGIDIVCACGYNNEDVPFVVHCGHWKNNLRVIRIRTSLKEMQLGYIWKYDIIRLCSVARPTV